jgi:4-hydroxy-3-polyprenylbenzoate decarboxylase
VKKKVIVAITGASGSIYAERLLFKLSLLEDQLTVCHVIFSENAKKVVEYELEKTTQQLTSFPIYNNDDFFAPCASGSAQFDTMIICPCTMGTLGKIAHGLASDLISRSADVILKEGKKLILAPREMPYNLIHTENMSFLIKAGTVICAASPSFYSKPKNLESLVDTVIDKILVTAGFEIDSFQWGNH